MAIELKGVLKRKLEIKSGISKAGKAWASQDFLIEIQDGNYSQVIPINAFGDARIQALQGITTGSAVTVQCNLQGKEFNGKNYLSLSLWKIETEGGAPQAYSSPTPTDTPLEPVEPEDLPF